MELIREKVSPENWGFFNSLNLQFEDKQIMADEYSTWVISPNREIIYTCVSWGGRDFGETYILIWGEERIYIYVESRSVRAKDGSKSHHCDIKSVEAPASLRNKQYELISLIREVANADYDYRDVIDCKIPTIFVIDNIAEPQFKN